MRVSGRTRTSRLSTCFTAPHVLRDDKEPVMHPRIEDDNIEIDPTVDGDGRGCVWRCAACSHSRDIAGHSPPVSRATSTWRDWRRLLSATTLSAARQCAGRPRHPASGDQAGGALRTRGRSSSTFPYRRVGLDRCVRSVIPTFPKRTVCFRPPPVPNTGSCHPAAPGFQARSDLLWWSRAVLGESAGRWNWRAQATRQSQRQ